MDYLLKFSGEVANFYIRVPIIAYSLEQHQRNRENYKPNFFMIFQLRLLIIWTYTSSIQLSFICFGNNNLTIIDLSKDVNSVIQCQSPQMYNDVILNLID